MLQGAIFVGNYIDSALIEPQILPPSKGSYYPSKMVWPLCTLKHAGWKSSVEALQKSFELIPEDPHSSLLLQEIFFNIQTMNANFVILRDNPDILQRSSKVVIAKGMSNIINHLFCVISTILPMTHTVGVASTCYMRK